MYFWMNGALYEPHYSHSRIILTRVTAFMTIIDDIFDTYGTTEESMLLAEAINRSESLKSAIYFYSFHLIIKY